MKNRIFAANIPWCAALALLLGLSWFFSASTEWVFPTVAKLLSSVSLVLLACLNHSALKHHASYVRSSFWIVCGMGLGFVGDVVMQRIFFEKNAVLVAIGVFGLGHVAYILAFLGLSPAKAKKESRIKIFLPAPLLGCGLWWGFVHSDQMGPVLFVGSLVYSFIIVAMASSAFGLWRSLPNFVWAIIGSVFFVLSDVLLGNMLFRSPAFEAVPMVIFGTYIFGQWAIVAAIPLALRRIDSDVI